MSAEWKTATTLLVIAVLNGCAAQFFILTVLLTSLLTGGAA